MARRIAIDKDETNIKNTTFIPVHLCLVARDSKKRPRQLFPGKDKLINVIRFNQTRSSRKDMIRHYAPCPRV